MRQILKKFFVFTLAAATVYASGAVVLAKADGQNGNLAASPEELNHVVINQIASVANTPLEWEGRIGAAQSRAQKSLHDAGTPVSPWRCV